MSQAAALQQNVLLLTSKLNIEFRRRLLCFVASLTAIVFIDNRIYQSLTHLSFKQSVHVFDNFGISWVYFTLLQIYLITLKYLYCVTYATNSKNNGALHTSSLIQGKPYKFVVWFCICINFKHHFIN